MCFMVSVSRSSPGKASERLVCWSSFSKPGGLSGFIFLFVFFLSLGALGSPGGPRVHHKGFGPLEVLQEALSHSGFRLLKFACLFFAIYVEAPFLVELRDRSSLNVRFMITGFFALLEVCPHLCFL